jgi:hypothetical protein
MAVSLVGGDPGVPMSQMGTGPPCIMIEVLTLWDRATWCGSCRGQKQRLVVRGGDSLEGVPLVGNWSEKPPTSRE